VESIEWSGDTERLESYAEETEEDHTQLQSQTQESGCSVGQRNTGGKSKARHPKPDARRRDHHEHPV
jgi:hypothetical protein